MSFEGMRRRINTDCEPFAAYAINTASGDTYGSQPIVVPKHSAGCVPTETGGTYGSLGIRIQNRQEDSRCKTITKVAIKAIVVTAIAAAVSVYAYSRLYS